MNQPYIHHRAILWAWSIIIHHQLNHASLPPRFMALGRVHHGRQLWWRLVEATVLVANKGAWLKLWFWVGTWQIHLIPKKTKSLSVWIMVRNFIAMVDNIFKSCCEPVCLFFKLFLVLKPDWFVVLYPEKSARDPKIWLYIYIYCSVHYRSTLAVVHYQLLLCTCSVVI